MSRLRHGDMVPPTPDFQSIKHLFENDRFAAASGVRLVELGPGFAKTSLQVEPRHLNNVGTVQGGVIFTLADNAFGVASKTGGKVAVAVSTSLSFLKATRSGTLYAEATEISRSRRLSACTVRVTNDAGELVALFQGTAYIKDEPFPPSATDEAPRHSQRGSQALIHRTSGEPARVEHLGPYAIESLIDRDEEGAGTVYRVRIEAHQQTRVSYHRVAEEYYYVLAGRGTAILNGEEHRLAAGDFLRLPPGMTHRFTTDDEPLELLNIHTPGCWPDRDTFFADGPAPEGFGPA